jgi:hypothetical protein
VLLAKYYVGDQIKKNELGGACSTYREERCIHTGLWCRERDHLEDLAVDGRIILIINNFKKKDRMA